MAGADRDRDFLFPCLALAVMSSKRRARRYSTSATNSGKPNSRPSSSPSAPSTARESRGRTWTGLTVNDYLSDDYVRNRPVHVRDVFADRASSGSTTDATSRLFTPISDGSSSDTEMDEEVSSHYPSAIGMQHSNSEDTIRQSGGTRSPGSVPIYPTHSPRPLTYASLPPTPISTSPPPPPITPLSPNSCSTLTSSEPPFSLWDYLREELLATDFDSHQEMKWERVSNFLNIPVAIEKVSCKSNPFENVAYMILDHGFRIRALSGFVSLHVHNSAYPVHFSVLAALVQHLLLAPSSYSTASTKSRPLTDASSRCSHCDIGAPHRREQDLSFDKRARHHQAVRDFQCPGSRYAFALFPCS